MDAQVLEEILKNAEPGKKAREIEIKIVARLRKHADNPKFTALGERLEKIKERHEQGFLTSLEFLKAILEIAKEVVEAERETDPEEERDRAKEALTELFREAKNSNTHIIVERIVTDIDDISKKCAFPIGSTRAKGSGWCRKNFAALCSSTSCTPTRNFSTRLTATFGSIIDDGIFLSEQISTYSSFLAPRTDGGVGSWLGSNREPRAAVQALCQEQPPHATTSGLSDCGGRPPIRLDSLARHPSALPILPATGQPQADISANSPQRSSARPFRHAKRMTRPALYIIIYTYGRLAENLRGSMPLFQRLDWPRISSIVRGAKSRVVYAAAGLDDAVATALADANSRLPGCVSIVLDIDPECFRLGYGLFDAVAMLRDKGLEVRTQPRLRVGLLVCDHDAWSFSMPPLLVEGIGDEQVNAIKLSREQAETAIAAVGFAHPSTDKTVEAKDTKEPDIGRKAMDDRSEGDVRRALEADPPQRFDISRKVRVFNSKIEFVELTLTGIHIHRRRVVLPSDLIVGVEDKNARSRINANYKMIEGAAAIGADQVEKLVADLRSMYLKSIPEYGNVILRTSQGSIRERPRKSKTSP